MSWSFLFYCVNLWFFFFCRFNLIWLFVSISWSDVNTQEKQLLTMLANPVSAPSVSEYFLIKLLIFISPPCDQLFWNECQTYAPRTTHHCQENPVLLTGNVLQGLGKVPPSFPDLWTTKAWRVSSPARHTGEERAFPGCSTFYYYLLRALC